MKRVVRFLVIVAIVHIVQLVVVLVYSQFADILTFTRESGGGLIKEISRIRSPSM
jgi:uncharacterized membrane protein